MGGPEDDFSSTAKLAAKVAHELNNPLDAVLRFISLAQNKARTGQFGDIDRHLADAQFGLQRMAEILRELMEIGREANQAMVQRRGLPLQELIQRAIQVCTGSESRQGRVVVSYLGEGTKLVAFDQRLLQVLVNLLRNAVDASPEDAIIRVMAKDAGAGRICIAITDQGPGIAPELLPELFTPFVTNKPGGAGHGLGLAISRELTRALGGELTLDSNPAPQTGCTATIYLPAPRAASDPAHVAASHQSPAAP